MSIKIYYFNCQFSIDSDKTFCIHHMNSKKGGNILIMHVELNFTEIHL